MESKQPMLHRVRRLLIVLSILWLNGMIDGSAAQQPPPKRPPDAATPTATQPVGENAAVARDLVDLLKAAAERSEKAMQTSAERSEKAVQATADSLRAYADLLRAETERSERATTREVDMIERTLAKITLVVQFGAGLLAGLAAVTGGLLVFFGWGSLRDIQRRVDTRVTKEIDDLRAKSDEAISGQVTKINDDARVAIDSEVDRLKLDAGATFEHQIADMKRQFTKDLALFSTDVKALKDKVGSDFSDTTDQINTTKDLLNVLLEDVTKLSADLVSRRKALVSVGAGPLLADTQGPPSAQKSVIWVDDQPNTTLALRNELNKKGVKVTAVQSTEELEKALTSSGDKFDLIVSDMRRKDNPREGLDYFQRINGTDHPPALIFAPKKLLNPVESEIDALRASDPRFLGAVSGGPEPFFTQLFQVLRLA